MIGRIARSLLFFLSLFAAAETDGRSIWDPDGLTSGIPAGHETDG
jgi:hypothetical protein